MKYEMWMDTSMGNELFDCNADSKKEALEKFRRYSKSTEFKFRFGNLYDFKRHTLREVKDDE